MEELFFGNQERWFDLDVPRTPRVHNRDAINENESKEPDGSKKERPKPSDEAEEEQANTSYSKYWCFTAFQDERPLFSGDVSYGVAQLEQCPDTGRKHWQGYVEFTKKKRLHSVQVAIGCDNAHCELRKGSRSQAIAYCKKLESRVPGTEPYEYGDCPVADESKSQVQQLTRRIQGGATYREISNEFPTAILRYDKGIRSLLSTQQSNIPMSYRELRVLVLTGPPGCGKTKFAYEFITDKYGGQAYHKVYTEDQASWWDGYIDQKCILIDDFEGTAPIEELLHLLGGYGHCRGWAIKGGFIRLDSMECVIFTSNTDPYTWYQHKRNLPRTKTDALVRRLTTIIPFVDSTTFIYDKNKDY